MSPLNYLVLPSPLLPSLAYESLAGALGRYGSATIAPVDVDAGADPALRLIERWAESVSSTTVLVAHSNAGYLAPQVRDRVGRDVPIVFMDAALPPVEGSAPLAPEGMKSFLTDLAGESSVLPPWTQWWDDGDLDDVIPAADRASIDQACPRIPLSYFETALHVPADWANGTNAYLAFGSTYAGEQTFARQLGWPLHVIDGQHLHFLYEPEAVASEVQQLVGQIRR